ncbi:SDR family NAD(P)-dependent oxidoreductase [Poseidonocella sp. HB161398]|uniref:SDR family NAD(P)-dependent oxidoreductase n=1 Tax=Poseidonocella sp. HB161398 TaxID=2320855 RepID=UPI0011094BA5|nr:SDR family NAD(P)-dependent oxidoreductase [Poseidonocella sp. HB161398]
MTPILITGGASGIGLAIAAACQRDGFAVTLFDMNEAALERARAGLPDPARALAVAGSVTDEAALERAFDETEARFGPLAGLVNSAGIGVDARALDTTADEFRRVLEVNLIGTFAASKAAAARMLPRGQGAIVNIASVSGIMGNVGRAAYGATKGGVITLTKVMAVELGEAGLRVNAVAPGPVETPMVRDMHTAEMRAGWIATVPQRRYGTPEEIAQAALFLLDARRSSYVNGQVLAVDGGFTIGGVMEGVAPKGAALASAS